MKYTLGKRNKYKIMSIFTAQPLNSVIQYCVRFLSYTKQEFAVEHIVIHWTQAYQLVVT